MNHFRSSYEETSRIRVLTANLIGVVGEFITQVLDQHLNIELVGNVRDWCEVKNLANQAAIFIIGFENEIFSSETCLSLLIDHPKLKILVLKGNNDEGVIYWQVLHCEQVQVVSAQSLTESIGYIHSLLHTDMPQNLSSLERN